MKLAKDIQNIEELISQITQAALHRSVAIVWKRNGEGETILNEKVYIVKVNERKELKIEFQNETQLPVGEDVLFALEGGILVFKSKVISSNSKGAYLSIPSMAKGIERRRSPRVSYKYEDRIDFELEIQNKKVQAYLLDLSDHGMCLSFSDETAKNLKLEQKISIIIGNKGVRHTQCIVKSIRVFQRAKLGRSELYAVGLEFS